MIMGNKQDTVVEIGYTTCVLDPTMHLLQIIKSPEEEVHTTLAIEFLHMVKQGLLPNYQRSVLANNGITLKDILLLPKTLLLKLFKLLHNLAWWIVTHPDLLVVDLVTSLL